MIPHMPIVNSRFLLKHLHRERIGAFRDSAPTPPDGSRFHVFEHRLNRPAGQIALRMRTRREHVLLAYARLETDAAYNLFEMVALALQRACALGAFGPE